MNKYLFLAACLLSQGMNAQVELTVVLNEQKQTVILDKNQQDTCVFNEMSIAIKNVNEDENAVVLELALGESTDSLGQVTVEFGNSIVLNLEAHKLEISVSKQ